MRRRRGVCTHIGLLRWIYKDVSSWCSDYDVALAHRRSPSRNQLGQVNQSLETPVLKFPPKKSRKCKTGFDNSG